MSGSVHFISGGFGYVNIHLIRLLLIQKAAQFLSTWNPAFCSMPAVHSACSYILSRARSRTSRPIANKYHEGKMTRIFLPVDFCPRRVPSGNFW